jgi:predicted XRE-type DNA-binding protein
MSLSISGNSFPAAAFDSATTPTTPPVPVKQTLSQQVQQLATAGQSSQQIATTLGVPLSEVQSTLGQTTTTENTQTALLALSSRLDVKA